MLKEIIETGKTVDDAINLACEKLGCERDECQWEIIDLPRRGFLGLKNTPARVKVSIETPDPKPEKVEPAPRQERPRPEQPVSKKPREAKPQPKQQEPKPEPKPRPEQPRESQAPPRQQAPKAQKQEVNYNLNPPSQELIEKGEMAKNYLASILRAMDLTADLQVNWEESGICIVITGEGLGAIIGRRGETLDSLQYLSGLVANRMEGDYLRITVDCGDYRVKRRATLEALAHKLSSQVLKTDISKTLEPMNPFERRIIHATVSTIEGVSSTSIGEEPNRRVVITSPTAKSPRRSGGGRPPQGGDRDRSSRDNRDNRENRDDRRSGPRGGGRDRDRDRDRRGGDRGGRGGRDRDRRPSNTIQPTTPPANPPKEAENKPLYGKIDLE